jgi:hypothetical protein
MIKEERESIFVVSDADTEWSICSFQPKMWTKIERQGYKPYKTDILDGTVVGKYYKIPYSCVSIRKNVKRNVSEEQRQAAAERLRRSREMKQMNEV